MEPRNISQTQNSTNAYLGRINVMRLTWRPKKGVRRVKLLTFAPRMPGEPWHEDGRLEIEYISVNQPGEDKITYHGRARLAHPPLINSKHSYMVVGPRRRCQRIKFEFTNVSQTETSRNAYLGRVNAIQSIRRPKKSIIRLNKLTFRSRIPVEQRCNDGEYG